MKHSDITVRRGFLHYMAHLRLHQAEATYVMYRRVLVKIVLALGRSRLLEEITPGDLNRAMPAVLGKHLAEATQEKHKRIVNTWFNRMVKWGYMEQSPVSFKIYQVISNPLEDDKAISPEEIERMMSVVTHPRDRALLAVMIGLGLRRGGLWNMRVDWLFPEHGMLMTRMEKVRERRRREKKLHRLPMPWEIWYLLREWLKERALLVSFLPKDHGYLWVNIRTGERLTMSGMHQLLERLGRLAGVERFSPLYFRHALGIWFAQNGIPLPDAQAVFGHESTDTTWRYYYKSSPEHLRGSLDKRSQVITDLLAKFDLDDEWDEDDEDDDDEEGGEDEEGEDEDEGMIEPAYG
jgi:integrase